VNRRETTAIYVTLQARKRGLTKVTVNHLSIPARSSLLLSCCYVLLIATFAACQEQGKKPPTVPGPMLSQGTVDFDTPEFSLSLVRSSQTVAALKPKGAGDFDFTPGDLLVERSKDSYFHLGDITLRLRMENSGEWKNYSTAAARASTSALPASRGVLASADLTPTLPADLPLQITRTWALEGGKLVLRFTLKNKARQPVQVGALGIPMIFNNVLNDRSLEEAHAKCSFYDPYIGEDAGYLQVTRLSGRGPVLLVVPDGRTPFEAYNPILDRPGRFGAKPIFTDPTPRGITFEGFYEWMVHSQAYGENEWKNVSQWNPPTSLTLAPGQSKTYGFKFLLSDSIRNIEKTLAENGRPVAIGVPGYILPTDVDARLFLKYTKTVKSLAVEPDGAIAVSKGAPTAGGWQSYSLRGQKWGRARVAVTYADGSVEAISYFVTKPAANVVADMGHFLTTKQWFTDSSDPFHRGPSVMTYDRELNQIVLQDSRVWIAGLSDEGGAGSWLAAVIKNWVSRIKRKSRSSSSSWMALCGAVCNSRTGPTSMACARVSFTISPIKCRRIFIAATSTGRHGQAGTSRRRKRWTAHLIIRTWPPRTGCCIAWPVIIRAW